MKIKLLILLFIIPFFASAQTTYYVDSLGGSDAAAGTSPATAWKSNAKVSSFSFGSTDVLLFKRPYHYYGALVINTLDSVGMYGSGANAIIEGFTNLPSGSWASVGGGVYSISCPTCSPTENTVILDGVLQQIARSPNTTYNTFAAYGSSTQITGTGLINPPDYTGTQLVIRSGHSLIDRVTTTSSPTGTLNFTPAVTCTTCGGNGFFLQNNLAFLDVIGEWFFNPSTTTLYMYFGGGSPTGHIIKASTVDTLCSRNGGTIKMDNIQFRGGNMINLLIKNTTNSFLRNINSSFTGGVGIYATSNASPTFINDTLINCLSNAIYNLTATGTTTITNCLIHDIGMIAGMGLSGAGATYEAIASGSKSVIAFNNIYNIGYIPIYTTGDSSQVHDNVIHDYCSVKDDGGGIYLWDGSSIYYPNQRKVLNNIIYNGHLASGGVVDGNPGWGGAGVYMDSHAKDILVDGNTIYNNYTGLLNHADSNTITNNIFSGNLYAQINIAQIAGLSIRGLNIQNNTIKNYLVGQKMFSATSTANDINSFGVVNNNNYYFDHGDLTAFYTFRTGTDAGTNRSFASWQSNTGFDAASTTSLLYPYTIKDTVIGGWNARIAYVANYPDSVPGIISFLGLGEVGTDSTKLGLYTYSHWMQVGRFGAVQLGNGIHYPVYVTLQLTTGSATAITNPQIKSRVDAILSRWKIKRGALFMTGYSNGGRRALEYIAYQPTAGDHRYAQSVKAVIGIVSEKPGDIADGTPAYPQNMVEAAKAGSRLLGFDQINDGGRDMGTYTKKMNDTVPGSVVYIRSQAGDGSHSCCFNTFYDSTQIWNSSNANINAKPYGNYPNSDGVTWLLRQGDTSLSSAGNVAPTANAGADQSITLPTSTGNLDASGSFPNGGAVIATYKWIKVSGPSTFTITNDALITTTVTGLVQGTYVFQVTVTDNNSLTATDQVTIVVVAASNVPPTANAGADQTITQPTNSLTLNGSANDPDGTIASYLWEQEAGASAVITPTNTASTVISNLAPGLYTFRLTVTDNGGATGFDEVQVTVIANGTGTEKIYQVSIARYQASYDTLWQRWKTDSAKSFNPRRTTGETSTILITLTGQLDTVRDNGPNYALNITGMPVPRGAIREVSYSTVPLGVQISGLDPQKLYTVSFGSSRAGASPTLITTFKSSQSTDTFDIQANNNYNTSALFQNLVPTSGAVLSFTANKKAGTPGAYISNLIIKEQGAAINTAPLAFAGLDQLISAPLDSVIVHAIGTDPDDADSVVKYKWTGSGPNGNFTIVDPDSATTKITGLDTPGTYQFTITVTDTHGSTGTDFMTVVVTASTGSISLVAPAYMRVARQQMNGRGPTQTRDTTFGYLSCTPGPNATSIQWIFMAGPAPVRFDDSLAANTRVWDLQPGDYLFKVIARNVTDTAFAYVQIKVTDWQTKNEYGCNNGTPVIIDVLPTSATALIKTNFSDQWFAQTGYRIRGNDIIRIPRNPLNGGIYQDLQFGGVSGAPGCPVKIVPKDTTVDVSRRIFWAFGNDSSSITHANIDGRIPSKGILYGFVTKGAGGSKGNFGLTCNLCAYDSIMGHYSDSVEVNIFTKNNQDSTHPVTIFNQFRFYDMFIGYNMFHSTGVGEAAYLGNTSPDGKVSIGGNKGPATRLDGLTFYRNYVGNSWLDGGQMVTAETIYNIENWYWNTGRMNQSSQRFVTDAGGANYVKIIGNFGYIGRDGLGDLAHGNNEIAYNYMGRMNNSGVGTGSYTFQFFPEAWGTMTGSALLEDIGQDSGYVDMHHNIADAPEIQAYRIYDPRNALSKNIPSLLRNNAAVDTLGRTVSQLFSNVSGAPYTTNNTVFTSRPLQVVDLSTQYIGPKFLLYWPADGTSAIFTNSRDAFDWYWNKLFPSTIIPCGCVRVTNISP